MSAAERREHEDATCKMVGSPFLLAISTPEPSSPRARSPPCVRPRPRTSPAARAIAVEALTVVADRPCGPAQDVGGQVAARDAGTHQQPAQSQHPVQVSAPALVVHPIQAPRTCREPDAAQPAMRRAHQIPQLRTDKRTGAPRVLVRHQRVPDPALLVGLHPHQRQVPERADQTARHVNCRRHRVREHTRAAHTAARGPTLRQRDVACRPEVGQRRAATRTLPAATPIVEIERFTNAIGDLPEAANALRDRPVQYVAQSGEVAPQAAPDLILNLHAGHSSEVAS